MVVQGREPYQSSPGKGNTPRFALRDLGRTR
jgi:hypothetical protein